MGDLVGEFTADLSRRFPGTSTVAHYSSDVRPFLHWWRRSPADVQRTDIDQFIVWQQTLGRARATINRRLVALRMWFEFQAELANAPAAAPITPPPNVLRLEAVLVHRGTIQYGPGARGCGSRVHRAPHAQRGAVH